MSRWQIEFIRWGHYGQEMMFLYLLLIPLYATEVRLPPILPFLIIVLVAALFISLLVSKTKSIKLALLVVPLIMLLGFYLEFPLLLATFLGVVLYWRGVSHMMEFDQTDDFKLFLFTLGIGLLYYFWFPNFEGRQILLFFMFGQLVITLLLKIIATIFRSSVSEDQKKNHMKWLVGSLVSIGLVSVIIGVFYPYIKMFFLLLIRLVAMTLGLIAAPILMLVELLTLALQPDDGESVEMIIDGEQIFRDSQENQVFTNPENIINGIIVILMVVGLYLIFRTMNKIKTKITAPVPVEGVTIEPLKKTSSKFSFKQFFAIKNEVRRHFYDLELKLAKAGFGRTRDQTAEEWLQTLSVEDSLKQIIWQTYSKVRYGNREVDRKERSDYKEAIKQVIKDMKEKR